jgi:glucosylceramidase
VPTSRGLLVALLAGALVLSACGSSRRRSPNAPVVEVVQTSHDLAQHLTRLADLHLRAGSTHGLPVIRVDDSARYQQMVGIGAALTDTSAWLLYDELPSGTRDEVMSNLFGPSGIRLSYLRLPIGASDFTHDGRPYTYDDVPPGQSDPSLSRFSIAHDDAYIIPVLRQMRALDPGLQIIAAPWSPPAWMKTNDALDDTAGKGRLRPSDYGAFARYLVKFVQAYDGQGVTIDALTPQNEPGQGTPYPGLNLSELGEGRLIVQYLVPALRAAGVHVKLYVHDFKWLFASRVVKLISVSDVRQAITGVAWHCYEGDPVVMSEIHAIAPALDQIESECSGGIEPGPTSELLIASFRNWATAVLMWNLALDPAGGPVEMPNSGCHDCTGVVTVDGLTHTVTYTLDYYQLGQLGKFVQRGAHRIGSNTFVTYDTPTLQHEIDWARPGVDDVAFENPDGSRVLMAYNNAARAESFAVQWRGLSFTYTLPAAATVTFVWR